MNTPTPASRKDYRALWFFDTLVRIRVAAEDATDGIAVLEHLLPHGDSPPAHIHHAEDEIFYILDGVFRFQLAENQFEVRKGETVIAPRGVPHTYRVESSYGGRCLTVTSGGFERFVRAISRQATREDLPEPAEAPTAESMRAIVEAARNCGIEFVGPPLL
jgi:quercetin dioxygenase-like cupin family protein